MLQKTHIALIVSFLLVLLLIPELVNAQCVMCGASIESSENGENILKGVKKGIGYLMLFPYLLIGMSFFLMSCNGLGASSVSTRNE